MASVPAQPRVVKVVPLLPCGRCGGVLLLDNFDPATTLTCMACARSIPRADYVQPAPLPTALGWRRRRLKPSA